MSSEARDPKPQMSKDTEKIFKVTEEQSVRTGSSSHGGHKHRMRDDSEQPRLRTSDSVSMGKSWRGAANGPAVRPRLCLRGARAQCRTAHQEEEMARLQENSNSSHRDKGGRETRHRAMGTDTAEHSQQQTRELSCPQ